MDIVQEASSVLNQDSQQIDDTLPDVSGFHVKGWKILLQPLRQNDKTDSGVIIPDSTLNDLQSLTSLCRVLKKGSTCYNTDPYQGEQWCEVGDYVLVSRNAGMKISYNGTPLIIVSDNKIEAVIDDPKLLSKHTYGES